MGTKKDTLYPKTYKHLYLPHPPMLSTRGTDYLATGESMRILVILLPIALLIIGTSACSWLNRNTERAEVAIEHEEKDIEEGYREAFSTPKPKHSPYGHPEAHEEGTISPVAPENPTHNDDWP